MKEQDKPSFNDTFFNAEWRNERQKSDSEIHWYAVRVTAQWERKLIEMLLRVEPITVRSHGQEVVKNPLPIIKELDEKHGFRFGAYVPIRTEIRQWSDRKKKIDVVQTPGLIFIRTSLKYKNAIYEVSKDHFGAYFSQPGKREPEIISDAAMNEFMQLTRESEEVKLINDSTFGRGDKIRILDGSLRGRVFYVHSSEAPNEQGLQKVTLEIRLGEKLVSLITLSSARIIKVDKDAEDEIPDRYNAPVK